MAAHSQKQGKEENFQVHPKLAEQDRKTDADRGREIMVRPGSDVLKEYYESSINDRLDHIRFVSLENKTLQGIREKNQGSWKIVELCREIMFGNAKSVEYCHEGIENDRRAIKEIMGG